jgi:hypothetical protein
VFQSIGYLQEEQDHRHASLEHAVGVGRWDREPRGLRRMSGLVGSSEQLNSYHPQECIRVHLRLTSIVSCVGSEFGSNSTTAALSLGVLRESFRLFIFPPRKLTSAMMRSLMPHDLVKRMMHIYLDLPVANDLGLIHTGTCIAISHTGVLHLTGLIAT